MSIIDELAAAAREIGSAAQLLQTRSLARAEDLQQRSASLAEIVGGSRSGEEAVVRVEQAAQAVRESAERLVALRYGVDKFLAELTD